MLGEVYDDNGTLRIRTLSGAANDGGLPVGSVFGIHSNIVPAGYLPCNGAQYDTTQYPALYAILGTNYLPDLREAVLVGTGLSDRVEITAHDVYVIGQFKDDQIENIPNGIISASLDTYTDAAGIVHSEVAGNAPSDRAWRTGTTTHGKQYGINYVIKATTGTVQIADPEIIALIENWADERFAHLDRTSISNACLFKYDAVNNTLVPIAKPTIDGSSLIADITPGQVHTRNIYEMGGVYYLGSLQPTIQPVGEFVSSTTVGNIVVASNDKWYTTDEISSVTYWFEVTAMLNGAFVYDINLPVTDSDLIAELNAATAQQVDYETWGYQEETDIDYRWALGPDTVGDLSNLTTTDKTNCVAAINEVNGNTATNATNIGDLTQLTTTDKSDLVSAINEVAQGGQSTGTTVYTVEFANQTMNVTTGYGGVRWVDLGSIIPSGCSCSVEITGMTVSTGSHNLKNTLFTFTVDGGTNPIVSAYNFQSGWSSTTMVVKISGKVSYWAETSPNP